MPLLAKENLPIPSQDLLSWCYDNKSDFDQDKTIYSDCADPSRCLSAKQVYKTVRKLIAGLRAAGVEEGDCVALHAFNDIYYPVLVQAIVGTGAIFVGLNPGYTSFELQHCLNVSKAKFAISEPQLIDALLQAAKDGSLTAPKVFLFDDEDGNHHRSWRSLLDYGEEDWIHFDDESRCRNTTAYYMFSSGTTGLPKAAEISHRNIIANHTIWFGHPDHQEPFEDRRLHATPSFHIVAAAQLFWTPLRAGRPAIVMRRFELRPYLENVEKFGITSLLFVPPLMIAILALARQQPQFVKHCLRNVKMVICGAAPLDKSTQLNFNKVLPKGCVCLNGWGATEASGAGCCWYYPDEDDTGSIGRWLPNLDVKLVDNNDKEVGPFDARGELCLRGPTIIKGYLNAPEVNSRDWDSEGFFHTGDIVYGDGKTGLWYIVDRRKELIKVRAFQVAPSEIEGVLMLHPKIVDAAVIGVPGKDGELPKAFVVRASGSQVSELEVKAWVETRLSSYKRVDGGVEFLDAIPRNASGKILKRLLREKETRTRTQGPNL